MLRALLLAAAATLAVAAPAFARSPAEPGAGTLRGRGVLTVGPSAERARSVHDRIARVFGRRQAASSAR